MGFPGGSDSKESTCNVGDLGSIPGLGRSPGRGHGNPLQYSFLENPHGHRSLVGYRVSGLTKSQTLLSKYTQHTQGRVWGFIGGSVVKKKKKKNTCQCRRYKRWWFNPWVGKIPWKKAWQPTPVFLPGESHEQRKLMGYCPLGCKVW